MGTARNEDHADFSWSHRGDVKLAGIAPMNLHEIGSLGAAPLGNAVVAAKAEAAPVAVAGVEPCPAAYRGMATIRAHNPTRAHQALIGGHALVANPGDAHSPRHLHSGFGGALHHHLMELRTPQSETVPR